MEALCKPPFSEPAENTETYMKSLLVLLSSHWTRDVIAGEKALAIELCCVLHRLVVRKWVR
jgi:hypothetical protein